MTNDNNDDNDHNHHDHFIMITTIETRTNWLRHYLAMITNRIGRWSTEQKQ